MATLIDGSKEVGLEIKSEKTKYMLLSKSGHKNSKQIVNVSKFKYLGTTVTNHSIFFRRKLRGDECLLPFSPEPFVFSSAV
jgi:hypothetical protein